MPSPILSAPAPLEPPAAIIAADDSDATETLRLSLSQSALPGDLRVVIVGQPVLSLAAALAAMPAPAALSALAQGIETALAARRTDRTQTRLLIAQEALADPGALTDRLGLAAAPLPLPAPALPDPLLILLARHLIDADPDLRALEQALMAERSALVAQPPADPLDLDAVCALAADAAAARDRDARTIALLEARCAAGREELEAMARQTIALTERLEKAETRIRLSRAARDRARAEADQALHDRDLVRAELDRFYRSRSYRLTAPLRWLRRRLRSS